MPSTPLFAFPPERLWRPPRFHMPTAVRIIALLVGGGVAFSSHGTKAAVRATANLSPEPCFEHCTQPGGGCVAVEAAS